MISITPSFIRTLKGAPLSGIILLMIEPMPVSHSYICRYTGYSDKPVTQALQLIKENGFLVHNSAGYALITSAIQLPLAAPELENRNFSDSVTTTTYLNKKEEPFIEVEAANLNDPVGISPTPNRNISDSMISQMKYSERVDKNLYAMEVYGITRNKTTIEIANQEGITSEYIHYHANRLMKENRYTTGLLITVIKQGDPIPVNSRSYYDTLNNSPS